MQLLLIFFSKTIQVETHKLVPTFIADPLSIILVLVISIIGSLIAVYAIGYMDNHEQHAPKSAAGTGRFFFFLIAFLGFMNGLVLANDLVWLSIFWELTTLCSVMLISHDGTSEAIHSAKLAARYNLLGGLFMTAAGVYAAYMGIGESLTSITLAGALVPIALLSMSSFTKSAQLPFQAWLLGAMVAPTPVSALLHSSTMVKAGSYLILRLAPSFAGTKFSLIVAVVGAFTFAVASALAIGQSNGKKVLAYSTIANLGLIVTCAGINTPLAYAAGVMLLVFHAISKALLFLCMGTIEQTIGSRNIEDMMGLMVKMPITTLIAVIGMVSMLVPPFGMLISKWMAIEAAASSPLVVILLVLGSALTVFFWAKWIGRISTTPFKEKYHIEKIPVSIFFVNLILVIAVIVAGLLAFPVYNTYIQPLAGVTYSNIVLPVSEWLLLEKAGMFMEWPLFVLLGFVVFAVYETFRNVRSMHVRPPYMCGENYESGSSTYEFVSLMDKPEPARLNSYYMTPLFGEHFITKFANPIALALLFILFGVLKA